MLKCLVMENERLFCFIVLFIGIVISKTEAKYSTPIIKNISDKEIIIESGQNLTLICEGLEKVTWSYPNNTIEGNFWSAVSVETSDYYNRYYAKLVLLNASFVDVGYYYCHADAARYDDTIRSRKIYVYVRDEKRLSAHPSDEILFVSGPQYSNITLPCRPTSPDVDVKLYDINGAEVLENQTTYNRHIGFGIRIGSHIAHYQCIFSRNGNDEEVTVIASAMIIPDFVSKPYIEAPNNGRTKIGDTYILNCTVKVEPNIYFTLEWTVPNKVGFETGRINATAASAVTINGIRQGSSILIIKDVHPEDAGMYTCLITDHVYQNNYATKNITVFDENGSYLKLQEEIGMGIINTTAGTPSIQWVINVDTFPEATLQWISNRGEEISWSNTKNTKYYFDYNNKNNKATLRINQITLNDSGVYQIIANNEKNEKKLNLTLIVQDKPTVDIISENYHIYGEVSTLECKAAGNPLPSVTWLFKPCENDSCKFETLSEKLYTSETVGLQTVSTLKINATVTGLIQCIGSNILDNDSYTQGFYVTDVNKGFDIWGLDNNKNEVAAGSNVKLHCAASKYNFTEDIKWYFEKDFDEREEIRPSKKFKIESNITKYTYRISLTINKISKSDNATLACVAKSLDTGGDSILYQPLIVKDPMAPKIHSSNMNGTIEVKPGYPIKWFCNAVGIPYPTIIWTKDDHDWAKGENNNHMKLSSNNTVFEFFSQEDDAGIYSCKAVNSVGFDIRTIKLDIIGSRGSYKTFFVIITILSIFFFCLVTVLIIKIKKEKEKRRELRIAGLINFEKGAIENLNADLPVDEQADLLPYDKKWEVPREKLKLGKQLGSGAFGVVMKADAFGIAEGETVTTVAVKMVKRNADYTYIKALASELKIMVHLGKHLNVVNLLGACTKNVAKRELFVIVEYCRFGNLHNYLLRHRDDFVNQIDPKTGNIDTSIGADFLSRSMSVASNQSTSRAVAFAGVDYRATPNPSCTTDSTVVCTPTGEDTMILSNNSSVQPEWRSNYRGDYKGNVRPTSTHDLLCWAFQVARGMEYLASRKVLHGDLAARNILLAEDSIVKICDFGLAKSMYKSDNYKKKGDGPLPVKWMAVESIRDRVFSTQSDVWSFGIVLWEFFSLARTPYPGMDADERLYNKLVDGYRMDQPEYSTKDIYQLMLECWHAKPIHRPSFTKLAEDLGNMLQDVVKKHYIDLNDPYIMMNTEHQAGHSDYLAMLSPPDYGNLASPGHEYVNGRPHTEEQPAEASGYLPMDIFSPRSTDGIFSFDVQKNKTNISEPANRIELMPMLHANESDNELSPTSTTKSFSNPNYQDGAVDINKSTPKMDSILPTSDNYINMPQQKNAIKNTDSFTNPSYIHMNNKNGEENDKSNYVNSHSRDWERPVV